MKINKYPITDDGTKKSLKGRCTVEQDNQGEYYVVTEATENQEKSGLLHIIYEDGNSIYYKNTKNQYYKAEILSGTDNITVSPFYYVISLIIIIMLILVILTAFFK